MNPYIKKRLYKPIEWYKTLSILPNLDKEYAPPITVMTYYWLSDSVVYSEEGVTTVTQKNFYFDKTEHNISDVDKIVVDGVILAVKRIEEYNNPITRQNGGVIVC